MKIIWVDEAESTNSAVTEYESLLQEGIVLAARKQTRGRGQKGNSWESEPGKNLSFSVMWCPRGVAAREQFSISECVALAVAGMLHELGVEAKVKWPNDVYVEDRKICGILIEHSVFGMNIERTVAGVGININQREFISDAPNPVSLTQLAGIEYNLEKELKRFVGILEDLLKNTESKEGREVLHERFLQNLWRGDGKAHRFRDAGTGETYEGVIRGVAPMGYLTVENVCDGERREYAFKEVEFLL